MVRATHRLTAFAILVAKRASGRKGKTTGKAADLFRAARSLLAGLPDVHPAVDRCEAEHLYARLKAFQNEYTHQQWGTVRIIRNRNLFLVEEGLRIYLWHADSPLEGYRLAATYCENYDSRYGNSLNGPSYTKVHEIIRFMFTVEALEAV